MLPNLCENSCTFYLLCNFPPDSCENCCACCLFCVLPPTETHEAFNSLPQNLRNEIIDEYDKIQAINSPCLWLDQQSGICLNYEHRPKICKYFKIGSDECQWFIEEARE